MNEIATLPSVARNGGLPRFPRYWGRPYPKECHKDKSAGKYLFPMTGPDPEQKLS